MANIDMEDVMINPNKYGLPTFEEFKKNPDKYRNIAEAILNVADIGSTGGLKNLVVKQTYEVAGFKCKSLEEVQKVCDGEGLNLAMLEMRPEVIPLGGGKCDILVKFVPKMGAKESVINDAIERHLPAGYSPRGK